jgi:beta-glucosidase
MSRLFLVFALLFGACISRVSPGTKNPCGRRTVNDNPFVTELSRTLMDELRAGPEHPFPPGFLFGSATSSYQIEAGNSQTDWAQWEKLGRIDANDRADDGPRHDEHVAEDVGRMKQISHDTYRLGIEWGRLFPTKEQFLANPPEPDPMAFAHYRALLERLRASGIEPMVTLQHFVLPIWLQNPPNPEPRGHLDPEFPPLLARYAAWAADAYGDLVDLWITVNEPSAIGLGGYIGGVFPPGQLLGFDEFMQVHESFLEAHARAYDELRGRDRTDANGDGVAALISFATHNRLWLPIDPNDPMDVRGARRIRYLSNLYMIDGALCGDFDRNIDEKLDPEVDRVGDASLRGRLDFIALNYYSTAWVKGADVEPFRGLPALVYDGSGYPQSDFGWDVSPEALIAVLDELRQYGLPIFITENGIADAKDTLRPRFIVDTMITIGEAIALGHDVRAYYHWSLLDNFEWASGFCPRFGLFEVDFSQASKPRIARQSARVYKEIIDARTVPAELRERYSYGDPGPRCK